MFHNTSTGKKFEPYITPLQDSHWDFLLTIVLCCTMEARCQVARAMVQQTLPFLWQDGCQCSLQLWILPWICAPRIHWVDQGRVVYEICPTLLHMASTGNRTPDLLILTIHLATCSASTSIFRNLSKRNPQILTKC